MGGKIPWTFLDADLLGGYDTEEQLKCGVVGKSAEVSH